MGKERSVLESKRSTLKLDFVLLLFASLLSSALLFQCYSECFSFPFSPLSLQIEHKRNTIQASRVHSLKRVLFSNDLLKKYIFPTDKVSTFLFPFFLGTFSRRKKEESAGWLSVVI